MRHAALFLLLALGACAEQPSPAATAPQAVARTVTLQGAPWTIREAGGQPIPAEARTTSITFREDGASGNAGCNRFFGRATIDGSSLRFGALGVTRIACTPPVMRAEQRVLAAFDATRTWRVDADGTVVLLDARGEVLLRLTR